MSFKLSLTRPTPILIASGFAAATFASILAHAANATGAATGPYGVWLDHTGKGAVEIKPCGQALCGHIVWVKDASNRSYCGRQIIGNAQPVRTGTWDKGWVFNPDDDSKYDVELKTIGDDKLQVLGYMGTKWLGETMIWRRAQPDLPRCDATDLHAQQQPPSVAKSTNPEAKTSLAEPKGVTEPQAPNQPQIIMPPTQTPDSPKDSTSADAPETAVMPSSQADDDADEITFPDIAINHVKTQHGRECRVRVDSFKIAFPCPD